MSEFIVGEVYFEILYPDREQKYPVIETLVYIGKNVFGDEKVDTWYFQPSESYARYGSILESEEGDRKIIELQSDKLHRFSTLEKFYELLHRMQQRRGLIVN